MSPVAMVAAPLALLLLLQRPSRSEALLGAGLLALAVWSVAGAADDFSRFESAWVCLLAGGTIVALALRPPARHGLTGTALLAVAIAAVAGVFFVAVTSFSWRELRWLAEHHYGMQARALLATATAVLRGADGAADTLANLETALNQVVALLGLTLPGLVLLQSVAALAAAWALYRWLARHPEGEPLPRLREFRFSDHLVWGIVLALVALVVPGVSGLRSVGSNLAAFFGGLYVARGLGIVAALAAAAGIGGVFTALLASLVTIFLLPLVMLAALALGVSDTWVDWRKIAGRNARG